MAFATIRLAKRLQQNISPFWPEAAMLAGYHLEGFCLFYPLLRQRDQCHLSVWHLSQARNPHKNQRLRRIFIRKRLCVAVIWRDVTSKDTGCSTVWKIEVTWLLRGLIPNTGVTYDTLKRNIQPSTWTNLTIKTEYALHSSHHAVPCVIIFKVDTS